MVSYFLPFWAIFSIFLTPYFLIPAAAATAAGFLAPDFLASASIFLKRAPLPSFAFAIFLTYFLRQLFAFRGVFFPLLGHIWVCGVHPLTLLYRFKRHYGFPPSNELYVYTEFGFPPSIEPRAGGVYVGTGYGGYAILLGDSHASGTEVA